jgi:hypothetical protein
LNRLTSVMFSRMVEDWSRGASIFQVLPPPRRGLEGAPVRTEDLGVSGHNGAALTHGEVILPLPPITNVNQNEAYMDGRYGSEEWR